MTVPTENRQTAIIAFVLENEVIQTTTKLSNVAQNIQLAWSLMPKDQK
jgi:hypothetical protein